MESRWVHGKIQHGNANAKAFLVAKLFIRVKFHYYRRHDDDILITLIEHFEAF